MPYFVPRNTNPTHMEPFVFEKSSYFNLTSIAETSVHSI